MYARLAATRTLPAHRTFVDKVGIGNLYSVLVFPLRAEFRCPTERSFAPTGRRRLVSHAFNSSLALSTTERGVFGERCGVKLHPLVDMRARQDISLSVYARTIFRRFTTDGQKGGHDKERENDNVVNSMDAKHTEEALERQGDDVAKLRGSLAAADDMVKETREKALYLAAEMENVRAIAKRDAEEARLYALHKFSKQLLDVADNLERAVESAEGSGASSASLSNLRKGVEMTSDQLQKVFRSQGLVKYGAAGEKFDPHLHDAMFEYEDPSKEPGTLGQMFTPVMVITGTRRS